MRINKCFSFAIGVVSFLAFCSARPAYSALPEPCSLISASDVDAVLGVKAGTAQSLGPRVCTWTAVGQSGPKSKRVTLSMHDAKEFESMKTPMGNGITKTPVSGLGDEAIVGKTPKMSPVLSVKKGNVVFTVAIDGFPDDATTEKEKTLALDVLKKL